jgi:O-acetyl-ADP-ribose deacetylase (regulator of RNase III)
MKNIIVTAFTLLAMGMLLTINPAFAGDQVKIYEMAESGITIEFPMTPEEIAAEEAENATQAARRQAAKNNSRQRFKVYEMAESGQTISFPMTSEEIAAEDAENARRAAIRKSKSVEQKKQVVIFELAESGVAIEFPVETSGKVVLEAIAEKNSLDDSKM